MKLRRTMIGSCLLVLALCVPGYAQEEEPLEEGQQEGEAAPEGLEGEPAAEPGPSDSDLQTVPDDTAAPAATVTAAPAARSQQDAWRDIVVVPRKPVLKGGRVELMPIFGVTINDNLIHHYSVGGEINYFLTDILSIGLQGQYFFKNVLDEEFYTRYHFRRIPSLNQYKYHASGHFAYVPLYGKFAIFNDLIMHFECYVTAGIGITGTEIIPRDYDNEPFSNPASLTFPAGVGARLFINDWLAVNVAFRDYMMLDAFEPTPRTSSDAEEAKENADTRFINNVMFHVGVSFFLPTSFKYTTFR